jgi:hypothetical protein
MTLPFYDELLEKKPRVCGAVVFSRFMKNPVVCRSEVTAATLQQEYKQFDVSGGSASSTENVNKNGNLAPPSHRSLPSTISSDDSSLRRSASTLDTFNNRHFTNNGDDENEMGTKSRSCIPRHMIPPSNTQATAKGYPSRMGVGDGDPLLSNAKSGGMIDQTFAFTPLQDNAISLTSVEDTPKQIEQHTASTFTNAVQFDPYDTSLSKNESTADHIHDPLPDIPDHIQEPVIFRLMERRDFYKSEADMLRQEINFFRQELSGVRPSLSTTPNDNDSWQEAVDVWNTIGNMEFAQPFSSKRTSDEHFRQQAENYFKKDWDFAFQSRNDSEAALSIGTPFSAADGTSTKTMLHRRVVIEKLNQTKNKLCNQNSHIIDSAPLKVLEEKHTKRERTRVSFMTPEVSEECEYDESCVTISVEPDYGGVPNKNRQWANRVMQSNPTSNLSENQNRQMDDAIDRVSQEKSAHTRERNYSAQPTNVGYRRHNQSHTEDECYDDDHESDVRCVPATTQTEEQRCRSYFQDQELEVIPEVDEVESSASNGEYTKDMVTIQNFLKKYGKRHGKRHESLTQGSFHSLGGNEMPIVQIDNIDAVVQYRETRDPDAWFERHANLSQDKEEREGSRRSARISLTVGLSPISDSQASNGSRRFFDSTTNDEVIQHPERSGRSSRSTGPKNSTSSVRKSPGRVAAVGKISKETLKQWETRKW